MEYVILIVGLAAVGAAWDGARRAIEASVDKVTGSGTISDLEARLLVVEASLLVTRNHLAELKGFVAMSKGRSR